MTAQERSGAESLPDGSRIFRQDNLTSSHAYSLGRLPYTFEGQSFLPGNRYWSTSPEGMADLEKNRRLIAIGNTLAYVRFLDDFPVFPLTSIWEDTALSGFAAERLYVVQTNPLAIQRCILMTTDPGDLVLDPTCGSGTTAYVAEQWGRRWITVDTSRVPLALARQRILTATFPWHQLRDPDAGPAGGFVYARRKNRKGEEVGGIVPHVTLKSIANGEPPAEEVLVDRPEAEPGITRVSGPFVVEAVLPTPQPLDAPDAGAPAPEPDAPADHITRMVEVLRRSPTLALPGGAKVVLAGIRRPSRTLYLSAEAVVQDDPGVGTSAFLAAATTHVQVETGRPFSTKPVAILFGPPDGAVTARAVLDAGKEANAKNYAHLYVIGFGFTAEAQMEMDAGEDVVGVPCSRVTVTLDVLMGDLLRTQRSSQIFAITGSPDVEALRLPDPADDGAPRWQVRLLGLDTFDPVEMRPLHKSGTDVPMWMLDTSWNGMAFHADQVFFPRTGAWDNLRRCLRATHDDSVWAHLAGNLSAPFAADAGSLVAVKVLDDRGNELLRIVTLTAGAAVGTAA